MTIRDFIVDLLNMSTHHRKAGIALQEYALALMEREVADMALMNDSEPAMYFSVIHHGESVSRRRCYGEHFKLDESELTVLEHWQARLQHLRTSLENPGRAHRQEMLAVIDVASRHGIEGAEDYVLHLWGSGWLLDLERAAHLLWFVRRAAVAGLSMELVQSEADLIFSLVPLGSDSPAKIAAQWTRQRGITSPMYERHASGWFGMTDMRVVRSRDNLGRAQLFIDVVHNESLIFHSLRYFLQEAYLLENPYLRTLERFIEDNMLRCADCEDLLRLCHRAALLEALDRELAQGRWEETEALLERHQDDLRIGYPTYVAFRARKLIEAQEAEPNALEKLVASSLGQAQRFTAEFGWLTGDQESVEEGRQVLQELSRPY